MSKAQEVIKYLALALAFFLIITIISCIMFAFKFFGSFLGLTKSDNTKSAEKVLIEDINNNLRYLDVDVATINVQIKTGKTFKVETNSDYIDIKQNNSKVFVIEKDHNLFGRKNDKTLTIYIPEDLTLDEVKLECGIGNVDISSINLLKGDFNFGIGNAVINYINVTNELSLDGGIGNTTIKNGLINNLELDTGMGNTKLDVELVGNNKIDSGVGKVELNLLPSVSGYSFKVDKGIGSVKYNDKKMGNETQFGFGSNIIEIDGGMGEIVIKTLDDSISF